MGQLKNNNVLENGSKSYISDKNPAWIFFICLIIFNFTHTDNPPTASATESYSSDVNVKNSTAALPQKLNPQNTHFTWLKSAEKKPRLLPTDNSYKVNELPPLYDICT